MSNDDTGEEWRPSEPMAKASKKTAGAKKAATKRTAKPKEPKPPKEPKAPKVPKEPKPRAPRKPAAQRLAGTKRRKSDVKVEKGETENQMSCAEGQRAEDSGPNIRLKAEVRIVLSVLLSPAHQNGCSCNMHCMSESI